MPSTAPKPATEHDSPAAAMTLGQARASGTMPRLDRHRLRAQLGLTEDITGANVRRATDFLLQRLLDYYTVIQYTGPGYVFGRVSSSWPSALRAAPQYNPYHDCWQHAEMNPVHPTCTLAELEGHAGWMCTDTAAKVAAAELATELPEARELFQQARYAIESLLEDSSISGVRWCDSRRRLKTPGIRKVLARIKATLPVTAFGIGAVRPVVLASSSAGAALTLRHVRDWSMPMPTQLASAM